MQIELLTQQELDLLGSTISAAEKIVVCAHVSPDGDALGSSLGLACFLCSKGKDVKVCVPDQFPDFLLWMPGVDKVLRYDKHKAAVEKAFACADLVFCLDFNTSSRLREMEPVLNACTAPKIMIDHHPSPTVETVLCVSRPELSSTSEMIFRIIWQMGGYETLSNECAQCIYCGMMTDTGGFTYNSRSPETYFIISQLLAKGIDKDKIYRKVYWTYSEDRLRLMGYILYEKMNVISGLHASWFTITREDIKRFHFKKGDAEGLVNMPLQIKGMKLSISLREDTEKENCIWVSLRSVDDFSCTEMAQKYFNGGGHLNASGGHLDCTMEEAEMVVQRALLHFANKLK